MECQLPRLSFEGSCRPASICAACRRPRAAGGWAIGFYRREPSAAVLRSRPPAGSARSVLVQPGSAWRRRFRAAHPRRALGSISDANSSRSRAAGAARLAFVHAGSLDQRLEPGRRAVRADRLYRHRARLLRADGSGGGPALAQPGRHRRADPALLVRLAQRAGRAHLGADRRARPGRVQRRARGPAGPPRPGGAALSARRVRRRRPAGGPHAARGQGAARRHRGQPPARCGERVRRPVARAVARLAGGDAPGRDRGRAGSRAGPHGDE